MYANAYLHIQALQFILLCLAPLGAYATFKNRTLSFLAVYGVAVWFLVFKGTEYAGSHSLPMDISAICYFLYILSAFLPVRPLKAAAAQIAGLCGVVYGLVMFYAPQIFSARDPNEMTFYLAIVNHALLFFGGLAMCGHIPFGKADCLWTIGVLAVIIAYTEICVAMGVAEGNAVFSQIVNGSIIQLAAPAFSMAWWYYALYYPIVFGLLALWIALTYAINGRAVPPKQKIGFFAV